ncbi:hypothetical protein [Methanospirillum lacunae]|uniref:Uncharacterized protein n=1 Tax=Methanospirillum lacunae TaxID=668570 RepID=A0A2V2N3T3_9EURY|nr:hypothetical protein [Methanospirillum lacunae]PWR73220.1 hypothetical protein DK846_05175 [Methanospirillum lacunae]
MVKKLHEKPLVIDLSIEGVTGIGATLCQDGFHFSSSGCSTRSGAQTSCTNFGGAATGACADGYIPNHTATMCTPGNSNLQGTCNLGGSANRSFCGFGGSPSTCYVGVGQDKPKCDSGNADLLLCRSGNAQHENFSS